MAVEIETSTDSVEQVKAAMGATVEVEEAPSDEEVKPPVKPAKAAKEEPEAEDEPEEDSEDGDDEEEPEEEAEVRPKPKGPSKTVPLSRLNQEIARRRALEQTLRDREAAPAKEDPKPEERPKFFSGKPEPSIEDYTKDIDKFDPEAMSKAFGAFAKVHSTWAREEARAEATYDTQVQIANERLAEIRADFEERKAAFEEQEPLYDELVPKSNVMLSDYQRDFVLDSEVGPHLLLYFVQHPKEAARIRQMRGRSQSAAMLELESEVMEAYEIESTAEVKKPSVKTKVAEIVPPKKPITSKAPQPPSRIRSAGPGPKSEQELAGPADRVGVDIDFNPEYERAVKARRGT